MLGSANACPAYTCILAKWDAMTVNKDGSRPTIGILLVDDHAVVRAALRMLIEKQPGMVVVGEAGSTKDAIAIAGREQPEIIVLDLCLGEERGLDLIPELIAVSEESKIIVLTGVQDPEEHHAAMRQGAMGVVNKEMPADMLLKAIERVNAGELWLNRHMTARLVTGMRRDLDAPKHGAEAPTQLTNREHEIISLVAEGLKNKQIADRLCISEATVRHHLTSILKKLDVSDRLELLIYAYQNNLVSIKRGNGSSKMASLPQALGRSLH
jgi:two-component system nitrate/nitrite response regulator NarL